MVDRASWPLAKLARAQQHANDLIARVNIWARTAELGHIAKVADDRLSWEVRLIVGTTPPLSEWSLVLGDVLHNLRSALDVLVWSHAAPHSLAKDEQRALMFPILVQANGWGRARQNKLKSVPDAIATAIRDAQPFAAPQLAEPEKHPLVLLNDLDVQDKHRLAVTADPKLEFIDFNHAVEFQDESAAARNTPPDVTFHEAAIRSDELLLSGRTIDPIVKIVGMHQLSYQVTVPTTAGPMNVVELMTGLTNHVTAVVNHVLEAK